MFDGHYKYSKTYVESVSSIPILESGPPTGPIENGTTYIVRPEVLHLSDVFSLTAAFLCVFKNNLTGHAAWETIIQFVTELLR